MSNVPAGLKYSKEHEWVKVDEDGVTVIIGITDYAQKELGDVVQVDLPKVGASVSAMETFGELESVKAVSELFSPVSGEVIEINTALGDSPELINDDPYEEGWMIKIRLSDPGELDKLLSPKEYEEMITAEV